MKSNFVVKCVAVVLFAVMLTTALLSGACLVFGFGSGAFTESANWDEMKNSLYSGLTWRPMSEIYDSVEHYEKYGRYYGNDVLYHNLSENLMVEIKDDNGEVIYSNINESDMSTVFNKQDYTFSVLKEEYRNSENDPNYDNDSNYEDEGILHETSVYDSQVDRYEDKTYTITICVKENLVKKDAFYYVGELFDAIAGKQILFFIYTILSLVVAVALLIFLMCSAGHKADFEGIYISKFDKFPIDILIAIWAGLTWLLAWGVVSFIDLAFYQMVTYNYDPAMWSAMPFLALLLILAVVLDAVLLAILLMTSAVRFKTETYIKSSLIYKVLYLVFAILKKSSSVIFRFCKRTLHLIWSFLRSIPLVWKTVVSVIVFMFIEFIILALDWGEWWPTAWIFNGILCAGIIAVAILLKRIKKGTEEIAKGNLYKKINTKYMFLDMKDHAININNINDGIAKAVEERMKSERFKTELITNVSHDIKTPLTSIINYVDLLEKEEIENETAKEYIGVLSRQSARLKKLVEDLLEASKASTGNVNVNLTQLELGILLSQALGEYDEKFSKSNLQVILNKTDNLLLVMADNRHIWRVFDNILNNISKYAQPNTRVYIDAKRNGKMAEISFRNISKDPLNISGDELMERFVRGDSSRNTEGSGLGLSIAKSLTEVQKGKLDIQIDGDLFKVRLAFPLSE
ncbi:MAG: HAMP domain-containing histidine kinase [Ruminococcaceae bacterium]|nr:HAMP domain-containing histidine kinase [Oscillospiraceae bacterium]